MTIKNWLWENRCTATQAVAAAWISLYSITATAASTITLRAPLDGFVDALSESNGELVGGRSEAETRFLNIRTAQARVGEATATSGATAMTPQSEGGAQVVVKITSQLLELQLQQEVRKLRLAREKVDLAAKALELEQQLYQPDQDKEQSRQTFQDLMAQQTYAMNHWGEAEQCPYHGPYCLGPKNSDDLLKAARKVDNQTFEDFKARQRLQVQSDLPARLDIAKNELDSEQISLELLQATASLGKVVCPTKCRIVKRYVITGQYVTKGDPLVDIVIQR